MFGFLFLRTFFYTFRSDTYLETHARLSMHVESCADCNLLAEFRPNAKVGGLLLDFRLLGETLCPRNFAATPSEQRP
jgi:hypothetical protein